MCMYQLKGKQPTYYYKPMTDQHYDEFVLRTR